VALTQAIRDKIIRQEILVDELSDQQLADFCITLNTAYRDGNPMVSDKDYDFIYLPALKKRRPEHPLLQAIEPEGAGFSTDKVLLPEIMLSTDKAYSQEEVGKWLERIKKSAIEIDVDIHTIQIKATPKLDGFAGYDDGIRLYTRGDGKKGSDISRVFERIKEDQNGHRGYDRLALKRALSIKSKEFALIYFMTTLLLIVLVTIASVIVLILCVLILFRFLPILCLIEN
jgi:DNA ligase (NAD+)